MFLEKFFPRYSRDRRYQEFLTLTQGDSIVEEYTRRFAELRRFSPHQDERDMTQRFVAGLSYRIRIHVVGLCCETVDRAITTAMPVKGERELFRMEQQHRDSDKGKSPVLSKSHLVVMSYTGSTSSTLWGKRFKGWFTKGSSKDQSKSHTPQQHRPQQ